MQGARGAATLKISADHAAARALSKEKALGLEIAVELSPAGGGSAVSSKRSVTVQGKVRRRHARHAGLRTVRRKSLARG
jgi:hypothetical protein